MPPTTLSTNRPDASARDQGGAVVDEALALDQRDDPARQSEPLGDGGGRGRVGRRDDCPEHERARPAETRDHHVGDRGHDQHRRQHEPDGEKGNRPCELAQVAKRCEERHAVKERRQDRDQYEIRRQLHVRRSWNEAEPKTSEDEQDRIRDADRLSRRKEGGAGRQQPDENEAVVRREAHGHASIVRLRFIATS
jgi:hypothetical protein